MFGAWLANLGCRKKGWRGSLRGGREIVEEVVFCFVFEGCVFLVFEVCEGGKRVERVGKHDGMVVVVVGEVVMGVWGLAGLVEEFLGGWGLGKGGTV